MGVRSTLLAGVGGALAGATAVAFLRPARVPADLRREMIEAAENFALAALEASDLVQEALVAHENGHPRSNDFDPAEQAIDALEHKMIRIGLVFGQDSRPHWRAIDSILILRVVLGILRGENGSEILRRIYGPWWAFDALHTGAQVAFREAADTEIRGAYLPLRRSDKAGLVDVRRSYAERDASPELLERLLKAREEARSSSAA